MRLISWPAVLLLCGLLCDAWSRPNILVILSDDQRADTIGALGNPNITTPSLDRLARSGTSFSRAYCMGGRNAAVCIPSRAMLMTGRGLFRAREDLSGQTTWPERFHKAGYGTFACGKWHNGADSLLRSFGKGGALFLGGMGDPFSLPLQDITAGHKLAPHPRPPGKHAVESIADAAVKFLGEQNGSRPFLLYAAMEAPHDPRIAPPQYHAIYNARKPPLPANFLSVHGFNNGEMLVRDEHLADWPRSASEIQQHLADYYASITFMDEQIGRILDALSRSGAGTNTIIVFASDQGLALGSHGLMGKQNLYEDAMRVPLIFSGPGITPGRKLESLAYLHDVFATIGARSEVAAPDGNEGIDLLSGSNGGTGRRAIFTAYKGVQRAARDEKWKLIRYPAVNVTQLFDLENDPAETNDLAGDARFDSEKERMLALLQREQIKAGDRLALERADSKPAAWSAPVQGLIQNSWNGFSRRSFTFSGRKAFVTFPDRPAVGRPWIWRMSFPDFHAEVDRSLLSNGWHVAHIDCVEMLGANEALDRFDGFYDHIVARYNLNARPALEAVSRGGLHAYRYAARHPERIACIYADTPVMDLKSWPLSWPGSEAEVAAALRYYGFKNETELREWRGNPVDMAILKPIAEARIPLRHVISLNDQVVPPEANTFKAARELEAMGHSMTLVKVKEGTAESHGHHFSLPEVDQTVSFIMSHSRPSHSTVDNAR